MMGILVMQTFFHIEVGSERLAACLHRPDRADAAPIVICCHGLTGTRIGSSYRFVVLARRLAEAGIACLRFDFRGCGESEGRFVDVTAPRLVDDLRAVLATIPGLGGCDASRMGMVASSFGAYTVSAIASEAAGVRGLVFLAPVAHPRALIDRGMNAEAWEFLRRKGWIDHHGLPLGARFIETLPDTNMPRQLAAARKPLLIFHGTGDREVPIDQGRAYEKEMQSAGLEVRFETIETSDHGMRGVETTQRIVDGSFDWLRGRLQPLE